MSRFETALQELWANELSPKGYCCLCGNKGVVDTRNKIHTPIGIECGALVHCICPNGRARKRSGEILSDSNE